MLLDVVLQEKVLLMKIDVEGFEKSVISSARKLLEKKKVDHIIMEYSPGNVDRE